MSNGKDALLKEQDRATARLSARSRMPSQLPWLKVTIHGEETFVSRAK